MHLMVCPGDFVTPESVLAEVWSPHELEASVSIIRRSWKWYKFVTSCLKKLATSFVWLTMHHAHIPFSRSLSYALRGGVSLFLFLLPAFWHDHFIPTLSS
jgi:hypothetical protein